MNSREGEREKEREKANSEISLETAVRLMAQPPIQLTQDVGQLVLRQRCKFPFGQAGANYQHGASEEHCPKHFPPD